MRGKKWLDEAEFLELFSLAQLLPGANPTNVAVLIGSRLRGAPGAAVALLAAVVPGFAILMMLAAIALDVHLPAIGGALRGCAGVAVGLMFANAIEMTWPRRRNVVELTIVAAVAVFVLVFHATLWLTLAIFIPVAFFATARRPR